MTDILDDLRKGALRSVDGSAIYCELPQSVIDRAIDEITKLRADVERLRSVTGKAMEVGGAFREIREKLSPYPVMGERTDV